MSEFLTTFGKGAALFAQQKLADTQSDRADREKIFALTKQEDADKYARHMDDFNKNLQLSQQKIAEGRAKLEQDSFTREGEWRGEERDWALADIEDKRKHEEYSSWQEVKKDDPAFFTMYNPYYTPQQRQESLLYQWRQGSLDRSKVRFDPSPDGLIEMDGQRGNFTWQSFPTSPGSQRDVNMASVESKQALADAYPKHSKDSPLYTSGKEKFDSCMASMKNSDYCTSITDAEVPGWRDRATWNAESQSYDMPAGDIETSAYDMNKPGLQDMTVGDGDLPPAIFTPGTTTNNTTDGQPTVEVPPLRNMIDIDANPGDDILKSLYSQAESIMSNYRDATKYYPLIESEKNKYEDELARINSLISGRKDAIGKEVFQNLQSVRTGSYRPSRAIQDMIDAGLTRWITGEFYALQGVEFMADKNPLIKSKWELYEENEQRKLLGPQGGKEEKKRYTD